jgi:hypothetical protein
MKIHDASESKEYFDKCSLEQLLTLLKDAIVIGSPNPGQKRIYRLHKDLIFYFYQKMEQIPDSAFTDNIFSDLILLHALQFINSIEPKEMYTGFNKSKWPLMAVPEKKEKLTSLLAYPLLESVFRLKSGHMDRWGIVTEPFTGLKRKYKKNNIISNILEPFELFYNNSSKELKNDLNYIEEKIVLRERLHYYRNAMMHAGPFAISDWWFQLCLLDIIYLREKGANSIMNQSDKDVIDFPPKIGGVIYFSEKFDFPPWYKKGKLFDDGWTGV